MFWIRSGVFKNDGQARDDIYGIIKMSHKFILFWYKWLWQIKRDVFICVEEKNGMFK